MLCFSSDSVLKTANTDYKKMGQRIFVFVIGGATRSEVKFSVAILFTEQQRVVVFVVC